MKMRYAISGKAIVLVLITVLLFTNMCFAGEMKNKEESVSIDTLSYAPKQYINNAETLRPIEECTVEEVCKSFIALGRASVRNESYQPQSLIKESAKLSDKNQYRISEYEYLRELYKSTGTEIVKDALSFSDFKCEIKGNTADAEIVEHYIYFLNDDPEYNLRYRKYIFQLVKDHDVWKIKTVTTNDPQEEDGNFVYEPIHVQQSIAAAHEVVPCDAALVQKSNEAQRAASLYQWSYDVSVAKSYAATFVNSPNSSIFTTSSTDNCQNFASQCVWAGLRGKYSDVTTRSKALVRPAIPKTSSNSTAANIWAQGFATELYNDYNLNWTWDNVKGFANMIETSSSYREGPFGNFLEGGLSYAKAGSVIYWSTSVTNPTISDISHAMFVTQANASVGSITKDDIKIAANTADTNGAYQSLSSYCSYSANKFSACVIGCGYYNVPKSSVS